MCRSGTSPAADALRLVPGVSVLSSSSSSSSAGGLSCVSPKWPLMPSRSSSQKAARGKSHDSTTMSPVTDSEEQPAGVVGAEIVQVRNDRDVEARLHDQRGDDALFQRPLGRVLALGLRQDDGEALARLMAAPASHSSPC